MPHSISFVVQQARDVVTGGVDGLQKAAHLGSVLQFDRVFLVSGRWPSQKGIEANKPPVAIGLSVSGCEELPLNSGCSSSFSSDSDSWLGANFVCKEAASDWESESRAGPAATDGRAAGPATADEEDGREDDGPPTGPGICAAGPATAGAADGLDDDGAGPGVCPVMAEAEIVVVGVA